MALDKGPDLLFCRWISSFLGTISRKTVLSPLKRVLTPLSKIVWPKTWGVIFGLSIPFHFSTHLLLYHYHTALMTVLFVQSVLKSGIMSLPSFILLFQDYFGYLEVSWNSIWILKWVFLFLPKMSLGFW